MSNGWTGGQYSAFRVMFGVSLLLGFAARDDFSAAVGIIASVLFIAGFYDRAAALALCLLVARTGGYAAAALLLAHAALPAAPYGSWSARNRADPDGGWRMPRWVFGAAWVVVSGWYLYAGATAFARGDRAVSLQVLYAPLALWANARPWIWTAMLLFQLAAVAVASAPVTLLFAHLFTLDPGWISPYRRARKDRVLYDGTCALCHGAVRFILAEDRDAAFRFAPLEGRFTPGAPDSIVVETSGGQLVRSAAAIYILRRLGGLWRAAAFLLALFPRPIRDAAYDAIARVRYRVFGRAATACPVLPPHLRSRFEA